MTIETTLLRLKGASLEWNDKDGTIEMADDQAGTDKTRRVADMYDRDFGQALVNAANAFVDLIEALEAIHAGFADGSIQFTKKRRQSGDPYHPANIKMWAALEWANG